MEVEQCAFFPEMCPRDTVCFFTDVETLPSIRLLCEEGTIGLAELLDFFVESVIARLVP